MRRQRMCRAMALVVLFAVSAAVHAQGQITDPLSIKFSDEQIRPASNFLAQSYYRAVALNDQWIALGANQEALDVLRPQIRALSDFIGYDVHSFVHQSNLLWQSHQNITGVPIIPNTQDVIQDGAPADGRPAITGADATNLEVRIVEFMTWLDTGSFTPANVNSGGGGVWLYTILDVGNVAGRDPTLSTAGLFFNRLTELIANYEANNQENLTTILTVATNPLGPQVTP